MDPIPAAERVPLSDGWTLWSCCMLRSAGFPIDLLERIASPLAAEALEPLLAAQREVDAALAACEQAGAPTWMMRQLRDGRAPESNGPLAAVLDRAREALARRDSARALAHAAFDGEQLRSSRVLRELAGDPRFREAVLWQNRHAVETGFDPLRRTPPEAHDSRTRKRERLLASYLQRYCAKNDTIGFFGPVGWATLGRDATALAVHPGPTLLETRSVYFEYWCIERLAATLAEDEALRPWLRPRRMPTVWLDGTTLHHPIDRTTKLPEAFARLLAACDGTRTARAIARELVADVSLELADEAEVFELLAQLVDRKLALWTLEIPPTDLHPERTLRQLLESLEDGALRARGLSALGSLEAAREDVARAAGDPDALDRALQAFESRFSELTGAAAWRRGGDAYAGRTLIYEDGRRDVEVTFGQAAIDALGAPLALLLQAARWYTYEIARRFRARCTDVYRRLARELGSAEVDYIRFFTEIAPELAGASFEEPCAMVAEVVAELQRRWASVIAAGPEERPIQRSAEALRGAVAEAFAAPGPGWPLARFHAPDVLLAAASAEAMDRGEGLFVLGEVHPGVNTVMAPCILEHHVDREGLIRAVDRELPAPRVSMVAPRDMNARAGFYSLRSRDLQVETGATRSFRPREQVHAVGELRVAEEAGALVVRSRDGRLHFDVIAFFEQSLATSSIGHFKLSPAAPHAPRVTIDRLVVSRETWRFPREALGFAAAADPFERFVAVRRWREAVGLPRFAFFKLPEEPKPCYVDFDSPASVELFAKLARQASSLVVSEMLPGPDACWLTDAQGRRYTCELRIAAVDPQEWRPGP